MNELTLTELDMGFSIPKILHASKPSVDHQGRKRNFTRYVMFFTGCSVWSATIDIHYFCSHQSYSSSSALLCLPFLSRLFIGVPSCISDRIARHTLIFLFPSIYPSSPSLPLLLFLHLFVALLLFSLD